MPKPAPQRCRLLYVEDQPESLELVEKLVAGRKDVLLLRAADADLGIKLALSKRPEVILINIDLPGLNGNLGAIQFMKRLRADPATETTPILALAADGAPEAIVKSLEAGFFQYLTKPLQAVPFMEALAYALEFAALERFEKDSVLSRPRPQPSIKES